MRDIKHKGITKASSLALHAEYKEKRAEGSSFEDSLKTAIKKHDRNGTFGKRFMGEPRSHSAITELLMLQYLSIGITPTMEQFNETLLIRGIPLFEKYTSFQPRLSEARNTFLPMYSELEKEGWKTVRTAVKEAVQAAKAAKPPEQLIKVPKLPKEASAPYPDSDEDLQRPRQKRTLSVNRKAYECQEITRNAFELKLQNECIVYAESLGCLVQRWNIDDNPDIIVWKSPASKVILGFVEFKSPTGHTTEGQDLRILALRGQYGDCEQARVIRRFIDFKAWLDSRLKTENTTTV